MKPRGAVISVHVAQSSERTHEFSSLRLSQIGEPHRRHRIEILLINRLAKITNDSIAQGAGSLAVIGIGQ